MKFHLLVAVTAIGLISCANAFAQTSSDGLTRTQVHAQLIEAQADGLLPVPKNDYPPSPKTIAHNKQLYAIQHPDDVRMAHSTDAHKGPAGSGTSG